MTKEGVMQLGSPETKSFRNPTAMKALHQIRYVVNELLRQGIIDQTAQVHVEYPRALNNPAQQAGLQLFQQRMQERRNKAAERIKEFKGEDYIPSKDVPVRDKKMVSILLIFLISKQNKYFN
jgi:CRISPR-associated endonuclease Csn1